MNDVTLFTSDDSPTPLESTLAHAGLDPSRPTRDGEMRTTDAPTQTVAPIGGTAVEDALTRAGLDPMPEALTLASFDTVAEAMEAIRATGRRPVLSLRRIASNGETAAHEPPHTTETN
jgi:hypothetical protein